MKRRSLNWTATAIAILPLIILSLTFRACSGDTVKVVEASESRRYSHHDDAGPTPEPEPTHEPAVPEPYEEEYNEYSVRGPDAFSATCEGDGNFIEASACGANIDCSSRSTWYFCVRGPLTVTLTVRKRTIYPDRE